WRDVTWQMKADNEGLKQRLWDLERVLEQAWEDKRVIREEVIWQYQELQKQTAAHSPRAECPLPLFSHHTATRLQESQQTQETANQPPAERDRAIAQLQHWLYTMEWEYEKILHMSGDVACSLDLVLAQLAGPSQYWEEVATTFAVEHKECLQEFSLNPLDI
ncbi:Coiled-coil domain-containing protein 153, partial [Apaloderma vittatum]